MLSFVKGSLLRSAFRRCQRQGQRAHTMPNSHRADRSLFLTKHSRCFGRDAVAQVPRLKRTALKGQLAHSCLHARAAKRTAPARATRSCKTQQRVRHANAIDAIPGRPCDIGTATAATAIAHESRAACRPCPSSNELQDAATCKACNCYRCNYGTTM